MVDGVVVRLVTTGYDQRLSVWEVDCGGMEITARWLRGAMVNIGDISCLNLISVRVNKSAVAIDEAICCVVGEGIELFSIKMSA